jgi:outer membrane receptor for ferrienterochelin and colicin
VGLYDADRIEVLKGAQPTLFCAAAANGAIRIISALYSDKFEASVRLAKKH